MLTFTNDIRPSYNHAWKNFVSNTTQTQYTQDDEAYHLKINLPGFRSEDIDISIEKGILEVSVLDQSEQSHENREQVAQESSSWRKRYQLPEDVDVGNIHAELKLGQLLLTLNKKPQEKAIKIAVQS
jgi:HSP20 family protein